MELPFLPDRDFFTMREASRLDQVPPHTLRYWENRFGDLRPARRQGGHRRYSRADLELVLEIKELLQGRKMTVSGARRALIDRRRGKTAFDAPLPGAAREDAAQFKLLREVRKELKAILEEMGSR
ncbi:MAG: MerR family transcriptional regulator [Elusimicrobia bacterium]|nr:MerR family transcriptional regulator [Elusimicrobiota bacterium]